MSSENAKIFALSTGIAISLSIWGLLASRRGLVTVVLCLQLIVLAGLAVLSWYLLRRSRGYRDQLGVVRLMPERRDGRELEYNFLAGATRELTLVGIIHRTFWSDKARFERALDEAVSSGACLSVYFLLPDSENLQRRATEEHEPASDWSNQIRQTARLFKDFSRRHPDADIKMFTYDEYPVWHLVLRDQREGFIGWYAPAKHGYDSPLYHCSLDSDGGIAIPALQWFKAMQLSAVPFDPDEVAR